MRKASLSVVAKVVILEEQGKGGSMAKVADAMIGEVGWCMVGGLGCRWSVLGAGCHCERWHARLAFAHGRPHELLV